MTEKARKKRNEIVMAVFDHTPPVDYEHATIRELCDISGISVGAFYHYFGDKAGFFSQVFAIVDDYILENVSADRIDADWAQELLNFCTGFAQCAEKMGARMMKGVYTSCPLFSAEEEEKRPLFTIPCRILRAAQEADVITKELSAEDLAKQLLVLLRGYVYDWSHRGGSYNLTEKVQTAAELFIRGIKE